MTKSNRRNNRISSNQYAAYADEFGLLPTWRAKINDTSAVITITNDDF